MDNKKIEDYIANNTLDLDRIVDDYTQYVRKVINNMVNDNLNEYDKEEILVDTFFVLWKNYTNKKNIYSLTSYIAGITKNLVKQKLKKQNFMLDIKDYENVVELSNYDLYTFEREELEKISNSIGKLKDIDIKIVNLFYYSSKSIKDIAKELNITEMNVKTRLHRIRKKIKKELEKESF